MKLVLLPGLDGTGKLFGPLLSGLSNFNYEVMLLPLEGDQDYPSIAKVVRESLPDEDFILIAESFSGPIGAMLAGDNNKNMKGIVFVATFLTTPSRVLLAIAQLLPLKFLSGLPFAKHIHRAMFLGPSACNVLISLFQTTITDLPTPLIKARMNTLMSLPLDIKQSDLPVAYLQAASDKLVSAEKALEFEHYFSNILIKTIEGPHFILQAKPGECAAAITELAVRLAENENRGV